ncbi:MAG: phosphohistidine phosphatase SixA [Verrucomicrobiota bacterium]|jgi:phosphohistidine phosphatase
MNLNLFVLRHGIAVEPGTSGYDDDSQRPLIPKGERRLRAAAAAIKKMELSFDLILSSPFVRARQTAEIAAQELKLKKRLKFSDALVPDGDFGALIDELRGMRPAPGDVLLVGHEPFLSRFISLLVSGGADATIEMKKGGLCKLEVENLRLGHCARLAWLLTPSQMELMD